MFLSGFMGHFFCARMEDDVKTSGSKLNRATANAATQARNMQMLHRSCGSPMLPSLSCSYSRSTAPVPVGPLLALAGAFRSPDFLP
jgi:hypothetical protein